ncbi:hypothetical protein [Mycobacterium noviomagense]|nr:hypothetical protein [Mycobacterium noviomagense]
MTKERGTWRTPATARAGQPDPQESRPHGDTCSGSDEGRDHQR